MRSIFENSHRKKKKKNISDKLTHSFKKERKKKNVKYMYIWSEKEIREKSECFYFFLPFSVAGGYFTMYQDDITVTHFEKIIMVGTKNYRKIPYMASGCDAQQNGVCLFRL